MEATHYIGNERRRKPRDIRLPELPPTPGRRETDDDSTMVLLAVLAVLLIALAIAVFHAGVSS